MNPARRLPLLMLLLLLPAWRMVAQPVLIDVLPGVSGSQPTALTPFQHKLYFFSHWGDLYAVDSADQPELIFRAGAYTALSLIWPDRMAVLGNKLYFFARKDNLGQELYAYDGINPPQFLVDVAAGPVSAGQARLCMTAFNNQLFFNAQVSTATNDYRLFRYDPATNTATQVPAKTGTRLGLYMTPYKGKLLMQAYHPACGHEIFAYDPATDSLKPAADILFGYAGTTPEGFVVLNDTVYFTANDGTGRELFRFDGQTASRIADLYPGTASGIQGGNIDQLIVYNQAVYFSGYSDTNSMWQLMLYDPSTGNIRQAALPGSARLGGAPSHFCLFNGKLYYSGYSAGGNELWSWDGQQETLEADIASGSSNPAELTVCNGQLYFRAHSTIYGLELFRCGPWPAGVRTAVFDGSLVQLPNPVTGTCRFTVTLKRPEQLRLTLADMTGRVVYPGGLISYTAGRHEIEVPMGALPSGTYSYRLAGADGRSCGAGKIVRQ